MLACCKFIVMKFCLMNKEKALRSVLAITHVFVVKFDILCCEIYTAQLKFSTDFNIMPHFERT